MVFCVMVHIYYKLAGVPRRCPGWEIAKADIWNLTEG